MPTDIRKLVERAFAEIGPKNPLKALIEPDKVMLWSYLTVYRHLLSKKSNSHFDHLEEVEILAKQSAILASRLEKEVFYRDLAQPLRPFVSQFQSLPKDLAAFSDVLDALTKPLGKPGQKSKINSIRNLVVISEFVKELTGAYQDEHVAELFQAINGGDLSTDFSGDVIRKKRTYFRRNYPAQYILAREEVFKLCAPRAGLRGLKRSLEIHGKGLF